jgi:beta-barrel assembly-enhancing protease
MTGWSRREWLSKAGMSVMALSLAPELLCDEPHVTISLLNTLSDEDEIELGRRFAAEFEKEAAVVSGNELIGNYLGGIVAVLAAKSQRPGLPYSIKLVNSHVPNALSLPGGFLYVNRGLVELITSEDELAAALSHEIGHVVARHVVNQLLLTFTALSMLKPMLENLNKQNQQNRAIEQIILKLGGTAAMLAKLHFNRRDEAQADLLGFYDMLRAGWDPNGYLKLFARLNELEKSSAGTPIPFLSDHPPTPERAAAILRELKLVTVPAGAATDSANFQIFKSAMGLLPEPRKPAENVQPQSPE